SRQASHCGAKAGGPGRLDVDCVVFSQHHTITTSRTGSVGLAHYAPGEFVFHKGDPTGNVFAIQSGTAGVYLDESANPAVILNPGENLGERSTPGNGDRVHSVSVKAETPLDLMPTRRNDFERVAQTVTSLRAMTQRSEAALTG